ncbi:MAG: hypothetical protein NVSMB51_01130 [Solirubrobacteraceae bacterium]
MAEDPKAPEEHASPTRAGADARLFADRYRVIETLKAGATVQTLLTHDTVEDRLVVIKSTDAGAVSSAARMRLEHEAQALLQIRSAALTEILDFASDGEVIYLVKPYVEGVSLAQRVADRPLSVEETLQIARDVLAALQAAHDHGVLHRDIKPANVIVDEQGQITGATLIDFGLAHSAQLHPSLKQQPVGTARYVSPEQAGVLDHEVRAPSDLYSVGIVLFECLAGRPPFEGRSVGELLRRHLTEQPQELRSLGLAVPRVVDELIRRLLRKDPRDRYQSAEAALADVDEIRQALAAGVAEPTIVIGLRDIRRNLTEPAFVGREREFELLSAQLARTASGQGGLVLVEAESGGGKSRLLSELAQRSAQQGAWVLRGHGIDQAAARPFQLLTGVASAVAEAAREDPELAVELRMHLGGHLAAVSSALPELAPALGPAAHDTGGPEDFAETRTLEALAALLGSLGTSERPAVVLFDDCQWADELTVGVLRRWQRLASSPGATPQHVLVLAAFRSEEVSAGHPLRAMPTLRHVSLRPFGGADLTALLESMAGELPDSVVELVSRLSEGNPFMASAVLRGLVESGALIGEQDGWHIDPLAMADVQSSREAAVFLTRRLELLPEQVLGLLSVAAVLGKEFDLELAASLAGHANAQAVAAVEEARRRHILWTGSSDGSRCAFVHDKLREALLARLSASRTAELHTRAAEHLEYAAPDKVFELAYHFSAAGQTQRALPYALSAARDARGRHALEVAEAQYRIAGAGAEGQSREVRREIAEGLGDVLMMRGRYDAALEQLLEARQLTSGAFAQARLEGALGELSFKRGDMHKASLATERALRLLHQRVPRSPFGYLIAALTQAIIQALHTLAPRALRQRRPREGAEAALLAARLHSRLAHCYWFQRGQVPTLWTHLRGMNLAERFRPGPELAQAYSEHAPVMTVIPWFSRGLDYVQRSLRLRRELRDPWGEGQSLNFQGVLFYGSSRYEECISSCQQAVGLLERTGDRWENHTARWNIALSLYRLGRLGEAAECAEAVYRSGLEIGDVQASGIALGAWAKATGGAIAQETIDAEMTRPSEDIHTQAEVLMAAAIRKLRSDRAAEAAALLRQARKLIRDRGLRQEYVAPVGPWLATALRLQLEGTPLHDAAARRQLMRELRRTCRGALRLARSYSNNLPHALRECALLDAGRGRSRRARRRLQRSIRLAAAHGAQYELAQSQLALATIEGAAELREEAEHALALLKALPYGTPVATAASGDGQPGPVTLSLVDRFHHLLKGGRNVATALSREAIFRAVRENALTLLRGQRCIVVNYGDDEEDITVVSGELDRRLESLCRELALRAGQTRRPAVFSASPGSGDTTTESFDPASVRCALAAPILVRGEVVACFYVAHREVEDLFGEEELALAEFLGTLAGAALENAEGFADVEALTRTLERRVEERTAQLEETNRQLDISLQRLTDAFDRERDTAQQLKHQAFHDALTDLANRALFINRVQHALERSARLDGSVGVLFLDLDDFKTVNDSLGHPVGDELLVAVAQRLASCVRTADTAARLGGDEFAVLLEDMNDPDVAETAARRIIEALEAPFTLDGHEVFVRASVGIALSSATARDVDDLLRNADVAMYVAKNRGKRRYEIFEASMHAGVMRRLELKADLQRALDNGEFEVHYQPIVDLQDGGSLRGTEALIRWPHPARGWVAPAEFVPLAEETGLIRMIGHLVLRAACEQTRAWQQAHPRYRELTIGVNLSARELQEPELVVSVAEALSSSGLPPRSLVLEITESVLMQDTEATVERLHALKSLGLQLAIDDFGTGYSSLGYLKRFPVDIVKIAKPFVDDVAGSGDEAALAGAIIRLSDTFNLQTIAEGIERQDQLHRLCELGCSLGQGYLFSRAQPAAGIEQLLRAGELASDISWNR